MHIRSVTANLSNSDTERPEDLLEHWEDFLEGETEFEGSMKSRCMDGDEIAFFMDRLVHIHVGWQGAYLPETATYKNYLTLSMDVHHLPREDILVPQYQLMKHMVDHYMNYADWQQTYGVTNGLFSDSEERKYDPRKLAAILAHPAIARIQWKEVVGHARAADKALAFLMGTLDEEWLFWNEVDKDLLVEIAALSMQSHQSVGTAELLDLMELWLGSGSEDPPRAAAAAASSSSSRNACYISSSMSMNCLRCQCQIK